MIIAGFVEVVSAESVTGWVMEPTEPDRTLQLRLRLGEEIVAECETSIGRPDVAAHFGTGSHETFGFHFADLPAGLALNDLQVQAMTGGAWTQVQRIGVPNRYQSIDGLGASDSSAKLEALQLDALRRLPGHLPLQGKRVLDLGCNEGFFCREAVRQGAAHVHGIDRSHHFIKAAKRLVPEAKFEVKSWWDVQTGQYDVIFFLSAIHYEERQHALLRHLSSLLTPGGTLILECGIWTHSPDQSWKVIHRGDGPKRYPTRDYLETTLLQDYAARFIGPSVPQNGDSVQRWVYHCARRGSTAILVYGESGVGKTTIARQIGRDRGTYSIDALLDRLFNQETYDGLPVRTQIANTFRGIRFNTTIDMIEAIGKLRLEDMFCSLLVQELPLDLDLVVLEGHALTDLGLRRKVTTLLRQAGVNCWDLALSPLEGP